MSKNPIFNWREWGENLTRDQEGIMKLTTPFTILNKKFNKIDFIRDAMHSKEKSTIERFYDDYKKMSKYDHCIMYCDKEPPTISNWYI